MMDIVFQPQAWEDYTFWFETDIQLLERINILIKATAREPFTGIGKPEALKGQFKGCWSRRIDKTHRLVYAIKDKQLHILQCRFHYTK